MKGILLGVTTLASVLAVAIPVAGAAPGGNGNGTVHLPCSAFVPAASGGSLVLHVRSGVVDAHCQNKNGAPISGTVPCEAFEDEANALGFHVTGGSVTVRPSGNVHGKCTVVPLT